MFTMGGTCGLRIVMRLTTEMKIIEITKKNGAVLPPINSFLFFLFGKEKDDWIIISLQGDGYPFSKTTNRIYIDLLKRLSGKLINAYSDARIDVQTEGIMHKLEITLPNRTPKGKKRYPEKILRRVEALLRKTIKEMGKEEGKCGD